MKKVSLAAVVAAITAAALASALSLGSSHREAPLTSIDPTADDTDVPAMGAFGLIFGLWYAGLT